ncbi:MAG: PIN domain-containing protein [Caulobacteraceae bacterium]
MSATGADAAAVRAIDTNVLVRVIARDDRRQTDAAVRAIANGAWVSNVVLAEATWVLKTYFGRSRDEIADIVEVLLNHDTIVLQDTDAAKEALTAFRTQKGVSFSDCLILEIARKAQHTPLCTFDRDLSKLEGVEQLE